MSNQPPPPEWLRAFLEAGRSAFENALRATVEGIAQSLQAGLEQVGAVALEALADLQNQLPPNWQRFTVPEILEVAALMKETGWSLTWTPPHEVLVQVLWASDQAAQERLLLASEGVILAELGALLARVEHPSLVELRVGAQEALEAYRSGYFWAAQALAANALATTFHEVYGHGTFGAARKAFEKLDPDEAGARQLRLAAVSSAVVQILQPYRPGDGVPHLFNRHASAHHVGDPQYRQLNSLTCVMLLVSLLVESQTALDLLESTSE